jgi:DNA-binding phage protein
MRHKKTKTLPWDADGHLQTEEHIADYLEAVFEDGDPISLPMRSEMSQKQRG